jgi:hypothetical protein
MSEKTFENGKALLACKNPSISVRKWEAKPDSKGVSNFVPWVKVSQEWWFNDSVKFVLIIDFHHLESK